MNEITSLQIVILFLSIAYMFIYIMYILEYNKRKKAEKYIYLEKNGKMNEYENYQKWG